MMIRDYINSAVFQDDLKQGNMTFDVLDPPARSQNKTSEYRNYVSVTKVMRFNTVIWMYVFMVLMTIVLWASLIIT